MLIYLSFGLLALSGALWLWLHIFLIVPGTFGPEHHPAEQLLLRLHGVVAYAFLVVVGALIPLHMRHGWRVRRNRTSGLTMASAAGVLALTGVGLYYIGAENVRWFLSVVHWSLGLTGGGVLIWHAVRGRAGRT